MKGDSIDDIIAQATLRVKGISIEQREKFSNHLKDDTDWKDSFKTPKIKPRKENKLNDIMNKTEREVDHGTVRDTFPSKTVEEVGYRRPKYLSSFISSAVKLRSLCESMAKSLG